MVIGVCRIEMLIHDKQSLKGKRQVLKKVIKNVENRFNASVAEVGSHELWQRAEIGVAVVGSDRSRINSILDKVINFIEAMHIVEIIDYEVELLNY